jgi:hypothetical protein
MPATYEPIATTTLGSATNTITFSGISGSYTDLRVVLSVAGTSATADAMMRVNGNTTSVYSQTYLSGNGTTPATGAVANNTYWYLNLGADLSSVALITVDLLSYTGSTNKTSLSTFSNDRNGSGYVNTTVNLFRSTSAVTSISLFLLNGAHTFSANTRATLYGILKA